MRNKIKTATIAASLCALLAAAGALAYFTDRDAATNQFEVGEVKIDLTEPNWDDLPDTDNDDIPDAAEKIVPTQNVVKDPMVTNTGKNSAYIFVKMSVPKKNIFTAEADGTRSNNGAKAVNQLFAFKYANGTALNQDKAANTYNAKWQLLGSDFTDANVNTYIFGYKTVVAPNASTEKLFTSVQFCNAVEGQGLENSIQEIQLDAYGIQSEGVGTLKQAYSKFFNQNNGQHNGTTWDDELVPVS